MEKIKIAELKVKLSAILLKVRKGASVTIFDRTLPIAIIHPLKPEEFVPLQEGVITEGKVIPPQKLFPKTKKLSSVFTILVQERNIR